MKVFLKGLVEQPPLLLVHLQSPKMKLMRRISLISICLFSLFAVFSCNNNKTPITTVEPPNPDKISQNIINIPASASGQPHGKLPKIVFTDTNFDFGTITAGAKVTHLFTFKNAGQADLVITGASASCGCTTPTYPHGVKHPGDTGTISVTFDSSNKSGKVVKVVTLVTNCQPDHNYLTINANIQPSNN